MLSCRGKTRAIEKILSDDTLKDIIGHLSNGIFLGLANHQDLISMEQATKLALLGRLVPRLFDPADNPIAPVLMVWVTIKGHHECFIVRRQASWPPLSTLQPPGFVSSVRALEFADRRFIRRGYQ